MAEGGKLVETTLDRADATAPEDPPSRAQQIHLELNRQSECTDTASERTAVIMIT
jgi:hypothetical protein